MPCAHQRVEEHVVRRFVGEIGIGARQLLRFVVGEGGGEDLGAVADRRMRRAHPQAVAPEQRARAAPRVLREPARAAAQIPSGGREIESARRPRAAAAATPCAAGRGSRAPRSQTRPDSEPRRAARVPVSEHRGPAQARRCPREHRPARRSLRAEPEARESRPSAARWRSS